MTPLPLEALPVVPMPDDLMAYAESLLVEDDLRLEIGEVTEGIGAHGWPVRVVQGRLFDAEGQRETRIVAVYQLLEWVGAVRLVARDRAAYEAHREQLLTALISVEPDFADGRSVCLADSLGPV